MGGIDEPLLPTCVLESSKHYRLWYNVPIELYALAGTMGVFLRTMELHTRVVLRGNEVGLAMA